MQLFADAPREFFDRLPDWRSIPLPVDPFAPVGMPEVAWHPYADVGSSMVETPPFNGTVNCESAQTKASLFYPSRCVSVIAAVRSLTNSFLRA